MSLSMHALVFLLVCVACEVVGRRPQKDSHDPTGALARLLESVSPASGWQDIGASIRSTSNRAVSNRPSITAAEMAATGMNSLLYQRQDLRGRVVLITGASAGIGEATAWRFAEQGCKLVLVARRLEKLKALADQMIASYPGLETHVLELDVGDIQRTQSLESLLPDEFKDVDILVNNAGLALGRNSIDETPLQDALTMMNVNMNAVIALTKAFVPGMKARGRGHIINLSSIAAHTPYAGGSIYCASKSALNAFSIAVMNDLVATPIRVTSISPGNVETDFSMTRFKGDAEKAKAVYENYVPLTAADIADQIIFSATAPAQVQIADIISWPTNQAAPTNIARVGPSLGAPQ